MTQNFGRVIFNRNGLRSKRLVLLAAAVTLGAVMLLNGRVFAQCGTVTGGPDNLTCTSDVAGNVNASGGNDTITVNGGVTVTGNVEGSVGSDSLVNNGTITGTMRGGEAALDTSGNDTLINNGIINGSMAGNEANDLLINNAGATAGGMSGGTTDNGADTLINFGTVNQFIIGSGGADRLVNFGIIQGLGGTGAMDGGADNDILIIGGSILANTITGGSGNDTLQLEPGVNLNGLPLNGGAGDSGDILIFNFTLNFIDGAETASYNKIIGLDPSFAGCLSPGGIDDCNGTITASGVTYTFSNFSQLIATLFNLIVAGGGAGLPDGGTFNLSSVAIAPIQPQLFFDDGFAKGFRLVNGAAEIYSGFAPSNPNGFLVGRVEPSQVNPSACVRFQDPGAANPGWFVEACPQGGGYFTLRIFDQNGSLLREIVNVGFTPPSVGVLGIMPPGAVGAIAQTPNQVPAIQSRPGWVLAFTADGLPFEVPVGFTANPSVRPGQRAFATGSVNIRTAPSLIADLTGLQIAWGTPVTVLLEDPTGYWFYVRTDDGIEGWAANEWFGPLGAERVVDEVTFAANIALQVPSEGVQPSESAVSEAAANGFTANPSVQPGQAAVAVGNVRVRALPSLTAARIGSVGWGERVQVLALDSSGYWFLIQADDVTGWAANEWFAPAP